MKSGDRQWLREAVDLARRGVGLASPNPCVGAVVVEAGGCKVGEGSYTYDGRRHAEVLALEQAGGRARGGTLFVSLEPCSVEARTPPCVDAILEAGVSRVVAASRDSNPAIDGAGLDRLRKAGVIVDEAGGDLAEEARNLNEPFFHYAQTGRPFVTLKTALTLDGKIAAPDDNTGWITSETARAHVQGVRHRHDAIMRALAPCANCLPRTVGTHRLVRSIWEFVSQTLLLTCQRTRLWVGPFAAAPLVGISVRSDQRARRREIFEQHQIPVQCFDSRAGCLTG